MAKITMDQIKELREKTQVGMMDCKNALEQAQGDMEKAIELLRKKGAAVAAKRADKEAKHGRVESYISNNHKIGTLAKLNTETDFSANTQDIKEFTQLLAKQIADKKPFYIEGEDENALLNQKLESKKITVKEALNELIAKINENIKIGDFIRFEIKENGFVQSYIHPGSTIGTIVELETDKPVEIDKVTGQKISQLAHDLCMQIAVTNPLSIDSTQLGHKELEKEREIIREQLLASGKSENMIDKIMEGKIRKYYEEVCLVDQPFIKNDKIKVKKYIEEIEKETGTKINIKGFKRFQIGG
ncbi:MAG: translation elongation factor Ts [bacterium]